MKLNDELNDILFLIVTGAIIYYLFSEKKNSQNTLYKGFNEDKFNLSNDWNNIYNDYNKSYNKIANG